MFGYFKIIERRTRFLTAICKTRLCHEKSSPSLCHLRISDIFFHPAKEIRDQKNQIRERSVIHLSNNYVVTCYQEPFHYTTKTSSRVYGHEAKNTYSNINKPHIPSINDTITQRIKLEWHSSAKHI